MVDTHLLGPFFVVGAAWPMMVEQHYGRVEHIIGGGLRHPVVPVLDGQGRTLGFTRALAMEGAGTV